MTADGDAQGGVGESFTAYSPFDRSGTSCTSGAAATFLSMSGGFEGDRLVMQLAPRRSARDTSVTVNERWTWTPVDARHVRRTSAVSTDGGKTWQTQFDGIYERTRR